MTALLDVSHKTALVTGASSGLGWHFASTLAAAGAKVVLGARRQDKIESLAAEIEAAGGVAEPVTMDVTDLDSIRAGLAAGAERLGPITAIVNNAGVASQSPALDIEESDWDAVIDTNLKGAWLVAQESARRLVEAGTGGSIINIASIAAFRVASQMAPYLAAKAGLVNLTRALALEWARHDIRVNALAPGYIETDMNREFFASPAGQAVVKRIPQRRLGQADDLDGALLLLASEASRYMTGSTIVIDGGHLQSGL